MIERAVDSRALAATDGPTARKLYEAFISFENDPTQKVCVFYGEVPLHILRWSEPEKGINVIHGEGPAEFCGVTFIPHLMKPHEQEAARLGPDEIFVIG